MMTIRSLFRAACAAALVAALAACVPLKTANKHADYSAFRAAAPHSILVVPVVNESVDVDAPDFFLSTIARPLAERGYYVFPVNLTKKVMSDDGLSDANMVHASDPTALGKMFGADAIMYIRIKRWQSQYMMLKTVTTVELDYSLKSGTTGEELWKNHESLQYAPQAANTGNLLGDLISAAVTAAVQKAKPNYIPLARQANLRAVDLIGTGLPAGPYDKSYGQDNASY
ncbi:GNA1162 family protein [Paraburkholderia sp.]|uniref:DUF799 domain-containing protein n=1 Tax=Paraburkholderia sp. TaxID=1926495 RepID=UPI00238D3F8D|nr:GNA1162 family protein [Paraburkholderia sp.]MDE1181382.1 DUF799 family lipoprotein [Paraburkholderia sp.]